MLLSSHRCIVFNGPVSARFNPLRLEMSLCQLVLKKPDVPCQCKVLPLKLPHQGDQTLRVLGPRRGRLARPVALRRTSLSAPGRLTGEQDSPGSPDTDAGERARRESLAYRGLRDAQESCGVGRRVPVRPHSGIRSPGRLRSGRWHVSRIGASVRGHTAMILVAARSRMNAPLRYGASQK